MTRWRLLACQVCGARPTEWDAFFQDPEEPEEVLCVVCYRWRMAWSVGAIVAADRQARWLAEKGGG